MSTTPTFTRGRAPAWSKTELALMLSSYQTEGSSFIAKHTGRSVRAVEAMGQKLGLARSEPRWSEDENQRLRELWPRKGMACIASFPGRSIEAVKQHAVKLGVQSRVQRRKPSDDKRRDRNCFGHIPGGAVASVFELGGKAA
jgi:hypothetical protein